MRWVIFALASTLIGQPFPAPKLVFSKIFGGASGTDTVTGVAADPMGNIAVIGNTDSPDFPVTRAYLPSIPTPPLTFFSPFNVANVNLGAALDVLAMARTWDGSIAYIASDSGIFRSADGGMTWTQQMPGLAGAVAIGVDGSDPNTVYAGVPFPLANPGGYKSTDGGKTWTPLSILAFSSNTPISCPNGKGGVVYTSADGLNRSTDGGRTWISIGPHHYNVFAFALAPSDANVVYTVSSDGLLYRSADGGNTWAAPGGAFTAYPTNSSLYVASLAVDPHNENSIWALVYDGNLYRSMDGGATFQIVFSDPYDMPAKLALDPSGQSIGLLGRYAIASFDSGATWHRQLVQGSVLLATNNGFLVGRSTTFAGFLTKFSADGSQMLFSTFLDTAGFVASDAQGNTIVAGAEVRKFDSTGDLIYEHPLPPTVTALTVDASGDALIAVDSGECPTIVKLDPSGNTIFSQQTQLCGVITLLAVDASGAIYAAGYPSSLTLATTPTAFQSARPSEGVPGFLAILSAAADKINYLSYAGLGASAMTVDASGNIYLAGTNSYWLYLPATSSFTFTVPGFPASYLYVMKVNPSSSTPLWMDTFGSPTVVGTVSSLQADPSGNVWFSGSTPAPIPLVAALEAEGTENSFAAEISADGTELLLSTYGPPYLALGPQNSVYLAGSVTPPGKSATSARVVKLDGSAAATSVIDSIGGAVQPAKESLPASLGIAPGEMIRISGRGLGPLATLTAKFDSTGRVATVLNGVQALVNGVPAPLISVQSASIVCMTPFEVSGKTEVNVQVVQNGVAGAPVAVGVKAVAAYPDILDVLNPDGTINSQSNPAHPGDTVLVYATGLGDTKPSGQDGALYGTPSPVPLYPVTMYYYANVSLAYAGPAPGIVEGIWQLNLALSKDAQTGLSNIELVSSYPGAGMFTIPVWIE